ncbi:MAG: SPOR domain-containing protein [Bacteroidia bacterium]|nr:SPOR domain-containing protein [Bacteroidia bacterium]
MINPENNIQSLLYDNDCVIIPDFGGFIKRENPTVLDKYANSIKPQGTTLFFNVALQQNDGLLANHIASEKSISYQNAIDLLTQWVKDTERQITLDGRFTFGILGTFFVNAEGKKWFSPNPSLNFSRKTFGLETIIAKAIIKDVSQTHKKEEALSAQYEKEVVQPTLQLAQQNKKKRLPLKIAASLLLLIGVGAALYITVFNNNSFELFQQARIIPMADTAPVVINEETNQQEENIFLEDSADMPDESEVIEDTTTIESPIQEETINEINTEQGVQNFVQPATNDVDENLGEEGIYTILAGAFLHEDNAQRRVEVLKQNGFDVFPVKPEDSRLTRIQCGKFSSIEAAEMYLQAVQKVIPQAHITSFK